MKLMLLGGASFWLPDTLLRAVRRHDFNGQDIVIVTAVMPLALLIAFWFAKRVYKGPPPKPVGPLLLAGVWFFGGFFIMLNASFSGGGFMIHERPSNFLFAIFAGFVPPVTWIMATYDGSLLALIIVNLVTLVIWMFQKNGIFWRLSGKTGIHKIP